MRIAKIIRVAIWVICMVVIFSGQQTASASEEITRLDCRHVRGNTLNVVSVTSGARGSVIATGLKDGLCYYNVRFFINGEMVVIKNMYNWELKTFHKTEFRERIPEEKESPEDQLYFGLR